MNKIQEIFNFDDIGGKIKNLAKWSCWITILLLWIATPILIIATIVEGGGIIAVIVFPIAAVIASLSVWVGSWALYAFGELVDTAYINKNDTAKIAGLLTQIAARETQKEEKYSKREAEAVVVPVAKEYAKENNDQGDAFETDEKPAPVVAIQSAQAEFTTKEKTLAEKLAYALKYTTDDGMIRYLQGIDDILVATILQEPKHLIRGLVEKALQEIQ